MADPAAPPFDTLPDALAWLDAHIDFEQNMPRRRAWPTLDRIHALTALLGEPQDAIPSIHVTGTNGKGSTSAMATTLLLSKGLSVGTYTSPNLHTVAERITRNTEPIDDEAFISVLSELALLEPLLPERPTRFDLLTAAAFSWFATEAVDTMVVEVGLGGTWDTTNVIHGDVAVLTNVSFDHTDVLGPTLEGIAEDKAGIIEPGSAVVLGDLAEDLLAIVEARAAEVGAASVWVYGRDFGVDVEPGRRGRAAGHAVDAGRPLRGRPDPPARRTPRDQRSGGSGRGRGLLRRRPCPRRWWPRALRPCGSRAGSRCWAAARCCSSTAHTTRRAWPHWATRSTTSSRWTAPRWRSSACSRAAIRRRCWRRWPRPAWRPSCCANPTRRAPCRSRRWPKRPAHSGWPCTRNPTCATRLRLARAMVDADGLVVVCGSLYVVGAARADALSSAVPWEDAGR